MLHWFDLYFSKVDLALGTLLSVNISVVTAVAAVLDKTLFN